SFADDGRSGFGAWRSYGQREVRFRIRRGFLYRGRRTAQTLVPVRDRRGFRFRCRGASARNIADPEGGIHDPGFGIDAVGLRFLAREPGDGNFVRGQDFGRNPDLGLLRLQFVAFGLLLGRLLPEGFEADSEFPIPETEGQGDDLDQTLQPGLEILFPVAGKLIIPETDRALGRRIQARLDFPEEDRDRDPGCRAQELRARIQDILDPGERRLDFLEFLPLV